MAGVSIARPIESPVPGCGGLGISLAVHIVTQHFKDHLPYHRIAEIYEREGLRRFVDDGRVPWTNNESERLLRSIVVGRKAWVYRGTFESAQNACVLWSLMQSCRSLLINPAKYLADVIEAMAVVPPSQMHEWTPRAYAARAKR